MRPKDFLLETYFDEHEFSTPFFFCTTDCEALTLRELLAIETGAREKFLNLSMHENGYEAELKETVAGLYKNVGKEGVRICTGGEDGIIKFLYSYLNPGDHVIVDFPTYQSLYEIPRAIGCDISFWKQYVEDGEWRIDISELKKMIGNNTKMIILCAPSNPTGKSYSVEDMNEIISIAREKNICIFADEMLKGMELDYQSKPWFADLYENAVSLGGVTKSLRLSGLRIAWLATQNKTVIQQIEKKGPYKMENEYGISAFLASLAIRHREEIEKANIDVLNKNIAFSKEFFQKYADYIQELAPNDGSVALHRIHTEESSAEFCKMLVDEKQAVLLPGEAFELEGKYIHMGYGKANFKDCMKQFDDFMQLYIKNADAKKNVH